MRLETKLDDVGHKLILNPGGIIHSVTLGKTSDLLVSLSLKSDVDSSFMALPVAQQIKPLTLGKTSDLLVSSSLESDTDSSFMDFPLAQQIKKSICQFRRHRFSPWVQKIPWRRKWQPTPVFLPEKSHGQRSLAGYIDGVAKSQTELSSQVYSHNFINEGEVVKIKTDVIWGH